MKKNNKRVLLKYDYTNKIKVIFDSSYNFNLFSIINRCPSKYFYKLADDFYYSIFDVSSFLYSLNDLEFKHYLSLFEVLFLLSKHFSIEYIINFSSYGSAFLSFPNAKTRFFMINSIDDLCYFLFSIFVDLTKKKYFYKFVKDLYSQLFLRFFPNLNIICINDKNIILHFNDLEVITIPINKKLFNSLSIK